MGQVRIPCPECNGDGFVSFGDRHAENRKDSCRRCGGTGEVDACTGEGPLSSAGPEFDRNYGSGTPSGCVGREWFLDEHRDACPTCHRGPCRLTFHLPVRDDRVAARLGELAEAAGQQRGLQNVREVAVRVVGEVTYHMYRGEPRPSAGN